MSRVTLISHTANPEFLVASAAKLCYSSTSIEDLQNGLTASKTESFIKLLMDLGHESPLEHITFTFGIEEVSRSFLAQITRHRIASYSVQSQRYVKECNFEYVIPPKIAANTKAKEEFIKAMEEDVRHYNKLVEVLKKQHKNELLENGTDENKIENMAEKAAIEDARFVLPNACATKLICTFNARSLLNFFNHRCCQRAQWEIREVAIKMLSLVKTVAPEIFYKAGPECIRGGCPEGKMSCGKMEVVKKIFLNKK